MVSRQTSAYLTPKDYELSYCNTASVMRYGRSGPKKGAARIGSASRSVFVVFTKRASAKTMCLAAVTAGEPTLV